MIDIKPFIDNPEELKKLMEFRGYNKTQDIDLIIEEYKKYIQLLDKIEKMNESKNKVSKEIGKLMREGKVQEANQIKEEVAKISEESASIDKEVKELYVSWNEKVSFLPNILDESVPYGEDEDDNQEIKNKFNDYNKTFSFKPKPHYELENIGLESTRAVKLAGTRFIVYKNDLAKLQRAVVNYMLDTHQKSNFMEVVIPTIVKTEILEGSGHLPKFKNDLYKIENEDKWLVPTAEVPLVNLFNNEILNKDQFPIRLSAHSNSYRAESDSSGKDIKGLIRLHEFRKVEMVSIVSHETSKDELEFLVNQAESILEGLEIPYRRVLCCSKEVSGASVKTYDLEVWMPGINAWKEISSVSLCSDYQARSARIRYKDENKKTQLVHTLNGSGLAVDRTVAAIVENYQNEDGTFEIPEVLKPYYER